MRHWELLGWFVALKGLVAINAGRVKRRKNLKLGTLVWLKVASSSLDGILAEGGMGVASALSL